MLEQMRQGQGSQKQRGFFWLKRGKKSGLALGLAGLMLVSLSACRSTLQGPKAARTYATGNRSGILNQLIVPATAMKMPESLERKENPTEKDYKEAQEFQEALQKRLASSRYLPGLMAFTQKLNARLLKSETETVVYSPLNLYQALSTLAEGAGGASRAELLQALGLSDENVNRKNAADLAYLFQYDDGLLRLQTAQALWLSDQVSYQKDCVKRLGKDFASAVYQGRMGDPAYDALLQKWLKDHTGGLLQEAAAGQKLHPDSLFTFSTALYFKGAWAQAFDPSETHQERFFSPTGEQTVSFLHRTDIRPVYQGPHFDAIALPFLGPAQLWLVRPEPGHLEEVATSKVLLDFLEKPDASSQSRVKQVQLSLPRFDIESNLDLSESFQQLGIGKIFSPDQGNFSPLVGPKQKAFLSDLFHASRLKIDEKGAEAAAFTLMKEGAAAPSESEERCDFRLDHPFLVVLSAYNGTPLLIARINQISE